jgi:hypothetical protein
MARCVVGKAPRSIRRSDAPNTMERCVCSMLPASLTVAPGLLPYPMPRTWHLHQKPSSCQRCPTSPASACGRRADACGPCCSFPSSQDWSRTQPRRAWIRWQRSHLVTVQAPLSSPPPSTPSVFSRAERAHWRMTWQQRLARNARPPSAPPVEIIVYGLATVLAQALGLRVA